MKISTFDRKNAAALQAIMLKALEGVAKEHGVTVSMRGGSLDTSECVFKFAVKANSPEASAANAENQSMILYALGLEGALGKRFSFRGTEYEVTGGSLGRHKFPVMAKRVSDGKGFKFPIAAVKPVDASRSELAKTLGNFIG